MGGQRPWEVTEVDRRVRVSPLHRPAKVRGAIGRRRPRPNADHVADDDRVLMGRYDDVAFRHLRNEGDDLVLLVLTGLVLEMRVRVLDERAQFTGLDVGSRFAELRCGDADEVVGEPARHDVRSENGRPLDEPGTPNRLLVFRLPQLVAAVDLSFEVDGVRVLGEDAGRGFRRLPDTASVLREQSGLDETGGRPEEVVRPPFGTVRDLLTLPSDRRIGRLDVFQHLRPRHGPGPGQDQDAPARYQRPRAAR